MNVQTPCPEPTLLKALLEGAVSVDQEGPLSAHLEHCSQCQQSLEGLVAGGASWAKLPSRLRQEPAPAGDAFPEALARAANPTHVGDTQPGAGVAGDVPLDPPAEAGGLGCIGPYEVRKVLGQGGMGVVFLAFEPALKREVAVKVLAPQLASVPSARQRFLREAQAAAAVAHDNIVAIHAIGEFKGLPLLVMHRVAGPSLEQCLATGPLPLAEVVRVGMEAARGLAAAHACGVVHRDIKPANLLMEATTGRIKITDFGLARAIDDMRLTHSGVVAGTPQYMAPEQARGEQVDQRADLFSLGSVLFALCTGGPPFEAGNTLALLSRIAHEVPPSARVVNPAVPRWLDALIAKLHAQDPAQRFQSADEVASLLERHLAQLLKSVPMAQPLSTPGRPAARPRLTEKARPRRRVPVAMAAVLLLVSIGVAAFQLGPPWGGQKKAPSTAPAFYTEKLPAPQPDSDHLAKAAEDGEKLAKQAHDKLAIYCYRCHGENGSVEGGFNYIMDSEKLVTRKKVLPGEPGKSRLLRRILDGEMPPEGENPRPGKDDEVLVERWIAAGAPGFAAPQAPQSFLPPALLAQTIKADLQKRKERDRLLARYFTLTHLFNAGLSEDELQTYRNGLSKLLNSLSWEKDIVVPVPVDAARTVLRIDLRDYGWTEREWDALLAVYPYTVEDPSAALPYAGTAQMHLRGDWFVATASRPPLYHQLLQLPRTERELERLVHIDVEADIRTEKKVARAGFNDSGVSRNNRLIERHRTADGAYWKTYDFSENAAEQNLFERPLGPGFDERFFRHAGSEIIFSLPNGLQGYMLVNGKGERIDKGSTQIVSDPRRPDRAVENGLSCMSCHSRGINAKVDQVRAHVLANARAFPDKAEVDKVLALYPAAADFNRLLKEDAERFANAAAATGAKVGTTEPILALAAQFEAPPDLRRAAAEVGLRPPEFLAHLEETPEIGRAIGALKLPGGTVQRQTFVQAFPDMAREWKLGEAVAKASQPATLFTFDASGELPPYLVGVDAVVAGPDGLQIKAERFVRTKDGDLLTRDFVFDTVFAVSPDHSIMVAGLGEVVGWNSRRGVQLRLHRPPNPGGKSDIDLCSGYVAFSRAGTPEKSMGSLTHFGKYLLRFEKQGKALTISVHAEEKGHFTEIMKRSIPDLKSFDPSLNEHNAFLYLGNSFKLKQVRLKVAPPSGVLAPSPKVDIVPPPLEKGPSTSAGQPSTVYQAHLPEGEKEQVSLSGPVADVATGGGGRYLILRLAGKNKLAVFDVQKRKVARDLPLLEVDVHIAAGADRLVVVYPGAKLLQLWNLATLERERTVSLPPRLTQDTIRHVSMGSASPGPLFVYLPREKRTLAVDLKSLEATDVVWKHWAPNNAYGPLVMRSSPDGSLLVGHGGGWAGLEVAQFSKGRQIGSDDRVAFSGGVFALPSADSRLVFAPGVIVNRAFSPVSFPGNAYVVPAIEPGFFLALFSAGNLPADWLGGPVHLPPVVEMAVYTDQRQRLFSLKDLDELKAGSDLHWEKRVHYYPNAGLLVTLGGQKDRLLLRRIDLAAQLEQSGADYLAVVSRPPLARPGTLFSYKLDIRSKKGGVKVKLESGPEGLTVTPDGRVSWAVPANKDQPVADVLLTVTDMSGQEVSHTFTIEMVQMSAAAAVP
jgi:serine/threonine protein kinase